MSRTNNSGSPTKASIPDGNYRPMRTYTASEISSTASAVGISDSVSVRISTKDSQKTVTVPLNTEELEQKRKTVRINKALAKLR